MVIGKHGGQVFEEFLDLFYKIRVKVGLYAAYRVVILDQAAAGSSLENVEDVLTVAETVEERGQGAEVHTERRKEQKVRVDTLKLVHNSTDVLHTVGHLDTHRLLDAIAQGVAVHVRRKVIQTVGESQRLRIRFRLAQFFDAAVYVSAVQVYLVDDLTVQRYPEMEYPVRSRVLGADVDHVFFFRENRMGLFFERAVLFHDDADGLVQPVFHTEVELAVGRRIVILAQRIPDEIPAEVQAAHILMPGEFDAQEIVCFAFVQLGRSPDVAHRRENGIFAVGGERLEHHPVVVHRRGEVIHYAEPCFGPFVHPGKAHQIVELHIGLALEHKCHFPQLVGRHGKRGVLAFLVYCLGGYGCYFFLYCAHKLDFIIRYRLSVLIFFQVCGLFLLCAGALLAEIAFGLHFALELHHPVQESFRAGRAAGDEYIHGNHFIDPFDNMIGTLERPTRNGASTYGDHVFRAGQLVVQTAKYRGHFRHDRSGHHHHIRLTRAGTGDFHRVHHAQRRNAPYRGGLLRQP